MRRFLSLVCALAVCVMPMSSSAQAPAGKTLDMYFIDTEGGQATLFVSPAGQTLLVDAGNAGDRDFNRILEVLKLAGVKQIDHFWMTHYHGDHYGSLFAIAKQIPIKNLYDHGPSIEGERPNIQKFQAAYAEFYKTIPRTDREAGLQARVHRHGYDRGDERQRPAQDGVAEGARRGTGRIPLCANHKERDESKVDPDNHQSAGFVMNYGRFRMIDLGDLTWSREFQLMCPTNQIGTIDLYLTTHHGLDQSGAPVIVHALQPRVAIMNNGTRKGGAVQTFQTLETSPGLEDIWQLHWSYAAGVEHNAPAVMIANIDERDQLAAILTGRADASGRSRRKRRSYACALHQSVCADRRLVHGDQQPQRLLAHVRR